MRRQYLPEHPHRWHWLPRPATTPWSPPVPDRPPSEGFFCFLNSVVTLTVTEKGASIGWGTVTQCCQPWSSVPACAPLSPVMSPGHPGAWVWQSPLHTTVTAGGTWATLRSTSPQSSSCARRTSRKYIFEGIEKYLIFHIRVYLSMNTKYTLPTETIPSHLRIHRSKQLPYNCIQVIGEMYK